MSAGKYIVPIILIVFGSIGLLAQHHPSKFPVVAYFPGHTKEDLNRMDVKRITHVHYAFVNPDSTGVFPNNPFIDTLSEFCKKNHLQLLLSIGGGSAPAYYSKLLDEPNRSEFVKSLVQLAVKYKADGIDIDLEGSRIDSNYNVFVTEMKAALKPHKKLLTAAIATAYRDVLPDEALHKLDYITIMSYDSTGPWRPSQPGQHSSYAMAVHDIYYWNKIRGIDKNKLYLGLPFYGYSFGKAGAGSMSFRNIVLKFPGKENEDQLTMPDGSILYYNGIATIKKKTKLAVEKAGGIMFWQILQDADNDLSLLKAINDEIKESTSE